jgi:ATPase subunit of ABC transporter with duplicated ATPase domains
LLRSAARAFGFSDEEIGKRCRALPGGEKARQVMALMPYDRANLLVLYDRANYLDIATKEMQIGALSAYEGTMLFVSHDRHFLAALSNRVLERTPEGVDQYGGGYTERLARTGHNAPGLHV